MCTSGFASEMQEKDGDEEEVLDAYESYTDIRKKIQEQKKARGYFPPPTALSRDPHATPTLKLTSSINGKIEQLKQRSRCFICQRMLTVWTLEKGMSAEEEQGKSGCRWECRKDSRGLHHRGG